MGYKVFEIVNEQHTSYNKHHFFDKAPLNLSSSEYGIQDFKYIIPADVHTIEGYCLHYVLRGKGNVQFSRNKTFPCEKGDIIITFPNIPVQFIPDDKTPWEYFYIMFDSDSALSLLSAADFSYSNPIYKAKHTEEIESAIVDLGNHYTNPKTNRLRAISTLLSIFSFVIEERGDTKSFNRIDKEIYIQKTFQMIEQRYTDPQFRVSEICSSLNISYSYLSQLFRQIVGNSIIDYIKNYRMREARVLLDSGELIYNAAERCGYNSVSHFTKEFKSMFQMTPSQYRERIRTRNIDVNHNKS